MTLIPTLTFSQAVRSHFKSDITSTPLSALKTPTTQADDCIGKFLIQTANHRCHLGEHCWDPPPTATVPCSAGMVLEKLSGRSVESRIEEPGFADVRYVRAMLQQVLRAIDRAYRELGACSVLSDCLRC